MIFLIIIGLIQDSGNNRVSQQVRQTGDITSCPLLRFILPPGSFNEGNHLKFDKNDPEQGLFLIDSKGKVHRVERFTDIEPKELTFRVPKTLTKDTCQVEVRTALATKELRVGKLPKPVTVQ